MNYFIFDGESSLDYGVYIGGQNTFNAPQRDVEKVAIPGRNGDLVQDNGRFLNVQVPYNIVVMDSFRDKTDAIKAWLLSKKGYCKLIDTYHPDTYRMAMVAGGIDFETAAYNLTGRTQVIFDCKPERFLDSGDEVFNVGEAGQPESASGSMVTFEGDEDEIFAKMQASISPTQDLHGYDYPWPAGGGKNIFNYQSFRPSYSGITTTLDDDGTLTVSGVPTANFVLVVPNTSLDDILQDGQTYTLSSSLYSTDYFIEVQATKTSTGGYGYWSTRQDSVTFTVNKSEYSEYMIHAAVARASWGESSKTLSAKFQLERGSSATQFFPYSNICPIIGRTGASVYRTGRNLFVTGGTPGGSSTNNGITFTYNADGTITLNGRNTGSSASHSIQQSGFRLRPGVYKKPIFMSNVSVLVQRKITSTLWEIVTGGGLSSDTFTITEGDAQYDLAVRIVVGAGLDYDFNNFVCEPYIYKNGEPLTYENPNYTSYPVSWQTEAGEVYGGTVDVVSGELVVDKIGFTIDGNAISPQVGGNVFPEYVSDAYPRWQFRIGSNITYLAYLIDKDGLSETLCNQLTYNSGGLSTLRSGQFRLSTVQSDGSTIFQFVLPNQPTTVEGLKSVLAANPLQVVYKLATPQTYQLSGQHIEVLLGMNNVWSDTGDMYVEWVLNPNIMRNPTRFDSRPQIRVKGSGSGTLTIENGTIVVSNLDEYVDIDSELMNCYKGTANKNADVALPNHEYPKLHPGANRVDFSGGVTGVEIKGRWWTI